MVETLMQGSDEYEGWRLEWCTVRSRDGSSHGEGYGVRTRYAASGRAERPPLVLLHGIGRSLEDWSASVPLAQHYRLYAPDLIGFGYTDKPGIAYTLEQLATFVKDFLEAVGETRPVTLLGNSLGGAVAQTFAVQYPERTKALVLVASAGFGKEVILALKLITVPGLGELLIKPSRRSAANTIRSFFHDPKLGTEERVAHTLDLARQPGAKRAFLASTRNLGTWRGVRADWREALSRRLVKLKLPTLLVWGEYDEVLPAAHLESAARLYPHAQAHLFRDTGHAPQLERAGDFNALVLNFLKNLEVKG